MNFILALATATLLLPTNQEGPPVYTGLWKNSRAKTTGNLAVVIAPMGDDKWKARFSGEFQGDPFQYDVEFTATKETKKKKKKKGSEKMKLKGRASVDSQLYTWTGWMSDKTFYGRFSSSGANGDFRLSRRE